MVPHAPARASSLLYCAQKSIVTPLVCNDYPPSGLGNGEPLFSASLKPTYFGFPDHCYEGRASSPLTFSITVFLLSRNLGDFGLCHAAGLISTSNPRLRIRLASLAAVRAGLRRAK